MDSRNKSGQDNEVRLMELRDLIINGLRYIEFLAPNAPTEPPVISVELMINIRIFLQMRTDEWYIEKFPEAFLFDMGMTRKPGDAYYSNDGITYTFNDKMLLTKCELYYKGKDQEIIAKKPQEELNLKVPFSFHFYKSGDKFGYNYINEIDHFFTHCINNYLLGIPLGNRLGDKGLNMIKEQILSQK